MSKQKRAEARQRAAERHRLELRRKKINRIVKFLVAGLAVGAVVGTLVTAVVVNGREAEQREQEVAALELNTPSLATAVGSFAVNSSGAAIPLAEADSSLPRIEFILDLHCAGCRQVETGVHDTMESMMEAEEAQFFFTPVSFMNHASTDEYSARAASTLVEVAETDPESFFGYISALYENFPDEGNGYPRAGVSYEDLGRIAKAAGVSEEAIEKFDEQRFRLWALENTAVVEARSEIFPDGISTPTVLMGGELVEEDGRFVLKDFLRVPFRDPDVAKTFRESFDSLS